MVGKSNVLAHRYVKTYYDIIFKEIKDDLKKETFFVNKKAIVISVWQACAYAQAPTTLCSSFILPFILQEGTFLNSPLKDSDFNPI